MSAKLLGLVGSPRKDGNTDVLVDEALAAFCEFPREFPEEKGETDRFDYRVRRTGSAGFGGVSDP